MELLASIPEWLGIAFVAAIGYAARVSEEYFKRRKHEKIITKEAFVRLSGLLHESESLFATQNKLAWRLLKSLTDKHPQLASIDEGYEQNFCKLYEKFSIEEKELHSIIRSITMNSLRRVNKDMSDWLKQHYVFKTSTTQIPSGEKVADYLTRLEHHLNLWDDKYNIWLEGENKNNLRHALVYLADEKQHGIGFPIGIEDVIDDALQQLK